MRGIHRKRYLYGALVLLVLLLGVGPFFIVNAPNLAVTYHAWHYRIFDDAASLSAVLQSLRNGESRKRVEALLGTAAKVNDASLRGACKAWASKFPAEAPDGFRSTDTVLGYEAGSSGNILQFRKGRLINHDPSTYEDDFAVLH